MNDSQKQALQFHQNGSALEVLKRIFPPKTPSISTYKGTPVILY